MKIGGKFSAFDISSAGMSMQRKKMNIISENIANAETTKAENDMPYKRQFLKISTSKNSFPQAIKMEGTQMKLNVKENNHFAGVDPSIQQNNKSNIPGVKYEVLNDETEGELIFMPNHPDADERGYVQMSNVNIITEMVEMISATRSYEANLTALNSAKQMAKDTLEI